MGTKANMMKYYVKENTILFVLIAFFIVSIFTSPGFLTSGNLRIIFLQSAELAIFACGLTFVVLNGGIDLSGGSIIALGSVVGASIMNDETGFLKGSPWAVTVAIIVMLAIGLLVGAINGFSVTKLKVPSFIVTLATMMVGSGIAVWYTKAETIDQLPASFIFLGEGKFTFIPMPVIIAICIIAISYFFLRKTLFGRYVYSIGTNPKAAFITGMPVKKTVFKLFLISGFCSAVAGIVMTSRLGAGVPGLASHMFLDVIASVIIGGTSMFGGKGGIIGSVIGAVFIITMNNSLNLIGVQWYLVDVVKGLIILVAAFADVLKLKAASN